MSTLPTTQDQAVDGSSRGRVPLLADIPLSDPALDAFGFVAFANALCLVVDHEYTATPLTIAISAPWGGGKSSVGAMMQTLLERRVARRHGDDPRLVCWFNAWEHEDASHLGAALAGAVAREASRHRSWWRRVLGPLPSAMLDAREQLRRTSLMVAFSLVTAGLLATLAPTRKLAGDILGKDIVASGLGAGVLFVALVLFQRIFATAKSAARFIDDPRSAATRGSMAEVKHQLGTLIRHATRDGRLVILVDDLDRCESARALEVCRVASQLLAHQGVVTVLLADMSRISESAAIRYAASSHGPGSVGATGEVDDVGRRYLEKIAQIELTLPPPNPAAMRQVSFGYSASLRTPVPSAPAVESSELRRLTPAGRARVPAAASPIDDQREAGRWPALIRWIERAKWRPARWGIGFTLPLAIAFPNSAAIVPFLALTIFVTLAIGVWSSVLRRVLRRRRKKYERKIQELKERGELSEDDIEADVLAEAPPVELDSERALISDLVSSSFLDSAEFRVVERFVADHPPRLPREGKRMFNHAQLMTEIARARQMFGGDPPLDPEHIAKWIVLRERWPALGRAVLSAPDLLRELEDAAATDQAGTQLDSLALKPNDIEELTDLLRGPPQLGALIERLIYFTPAPSSTTPDGYPTAPPVAYTSDDPGPVIKVTPPPPSST